MKIQVTVVLRGAEREGVHYLAAKKEDGFARKKRLLRTRNTSCGSPWHVGTGGRVLGGLLVSSWEEGMCGRVQLVKGSGGKWR